jgi:hypothetical protein
MAVIIATQEAEIRRIVVRCLEKLLRPIENTQQKAWQSGLCGRVPD